MNVRVTTSGGDGGTNLAFLNRHGRLVVKPARGEQGAASASTSTMERALHAAVLKARKVCETVMLEEYVSGEDLRIVVINDAVVAAAVRRPPRVIGNGEHSIRQLIKKQSRRRAAATGGESHIPVDDETRRRIDAAGYNLDSILPEGERADSSQDRQSAYRWDDS